MTDHLAMWECMLASFASVFTHPSFALWQLLVGGWVLCPGRRTITRIIAVIDPCGVHAHDAYHRFLRAGVWQMQILWRMLACRLVATHCPTGTIFLDVDDTLFHKSGPKVEGVAIFRDAVRSTTKLIVYALGLNLVVLTLRVTPPWCGVPLGLPINLRLYRKGGPSHLALAANMVHEVAAWFPDRSFHLSADGAYASLAGEELPRTHLTSRMRRDAALYDLPIVPRVRRRGRPRKKGLRLPSPAQLAAHTTVGWHTRTVNLRGTPTKRLLLSRVVLWYKACKDRPVLLVISRDPRGKEPDDFFFTTDIHASPAAVVERYAGRWSIEDTFRDVKQLLGGEDPQTWKRHGPARAAALSFWIYSAVWWWHLSAYGSSCSWPSRPWYTSKSSPCFADALASLRSVLWRRRIYPSSPLQPLDPEIIDGVIAVLARAA